MTSSDNPSLRIARQSGGVILTVGGTLDLAGSIRLGAALGDLIDGQGNLSVGIDLRRVMRFDAAGLGVFTVADHLARRRGGTLTVTAPLPLSALAPEAIGASRAQVHEHLVEFYDSDAFLVASVRDYLAPALRQGDGALVIATPGHRHAFASALAGSGVDLEAAGEEGRYLAVDAEEALSRFMTERGADPSRFTTMVNDLVAGVTRSGRRVRVYGEMVAVLWAEGNVFAAIAVEDLWNDLARLHPLSVLCAYPTAGFGTVETAGSFRAVCQLHG
jgi:anti-anti-sigma regulatory factor